MIAFAGCLVAILACQDFDRTVGPVTPSSPASIASSPAVLSLTCTFGQAASTISCIALGPVDSRLVNASVIYGATPTYAIFYPYNLVKDTVAHAWSFTAYLQNLLQQSVGTLNGSTVTGVKVFVTDFHATAGVGAVSIANADGIGNFTAPNQPYFNYNQIIAPSAYSGTKNWRFNIPNSVTAVSMSILISTDFPAEQNVALLPPDTNPTWFPLDSNWRNGYMKRVVTVIFRDGTTLADRQLAVAFVGGTLVGGVRGIVGSEGIYNVQITGNGSDVTLNAAIARLKTLPQVLDATLRAGGRAGYVKPYDGIGWRNWSLSPDSSSFDQNWASEAINAPYAWGCSTGSPSTTVAVLDHVFTAGELASNTVFGATTFGTYPGHFAHGAYVAGILGARGNDSVGMSGVMWRVGLRLRDFGADIVGYDDMAKAILAEGNAGTKVVNLSYWSGTLTHSASDSVRMYQELVPVMNLLRPAYLNGTMPLLVTISGDSGFDAHFSMLAILHDSLPRRTLVVGGTNIARARTGQSGTGHLVDVYAPSSNVYSEAGSSPSTVAWQMLEGTSFAAPQVSGIAGLLLSVSPALSPDSLKQFIVRGAQIGGRVVSEPDGTHHYLVNAYESLKIAARQNGASVCQSRVWSQGTQLLVQRDSTSSTGEVIFDGGSTIYQVAVKHDGVIRFTDSLAYREITYLAGHWTETTASGMSDTIAGGPDRSRVALSHNGDSAVWISGNPNDIFPNHYDVSIGPSDGSSRTIIASPAWIAEPGSTICDARDATTHTCDLFMNTAQFRGTIPEMSPVATFSPNGKEVLVAISRFQNLPSNTGGWATCSGIPGEQCWSQQFLRTPLRSDVYSVNLYTHAITLLFSEPGNRIVSLGVSEGGAMEVFYNMDAPSGAILVQDNFPAYLAGLSGEHNCILRYRQRGFATPALSISKFAGCQDGEVPGSLSPRRVSGYTASLTDPTTAH